MNKYAELKRLVGAWVLAEYALRREAYLPDIPGGRTDALLEAEVALRKAVTGREDTISAGLKLGAEPCNTSKPARALMKLVSQGTAPKAQRKHPKPAQRKDAPAKQAGVAKHNKVVQPERRKGKRPKQRKGFFSQ